jgi:hypothetical protein
LEKARSSGRAFFMMKAFVQKVRAKAALQMKKELSSSVKLQVPHSSPLLA